MPASPVTIDIEITRDPYENAVRYNGGVPFNPTVHRLISPAWLTSYRRECRRPDLFAYVHERTDNMVLAVWLYPPGRPHPIGLMTELEVSVPVAPRPPGWAGGRWVPPNRDYMVARCRPLADQMADIIRQCDAASAADRAAAEAERDARRDDARVYRRFNLDREAAALVNGSIPYDPSDSDDESLVS